MIWTEIFLCALLFTIGLKFWLAQRHFKAVSSNQHQVPSDFAEHIQLHDHQKAARYTLTKTRFGLLHFIFEVFVLIGFTLLGGLDFLQSYTTQWASGLWAGVTLIAAFSLITSLLDLPWSYYQQFVIEQQFGFNRMSKQLWLIDLFRGLLLSIALGGPLLILILYLMTQIQTYWWLAAWGVWFGFSLLLMWLYPTVIAPLFNQFKPLQDGPTKSKILSLLQRCNFNSDGLFVMDGSKRSSHGNAYFSGLGKAKRIVFFDTLLERLNDDQIEAVLAHELGHFKKKHIQTMLFISGLLSLILFAVLGYLANSSWFYTGLGVTPDLANGSQALALILFLLVLPYFTFLFKPVFSWLSRKNEFEADAYAAQHTQAQHLISALVKLYQDNAATLTPDSCYSAFYDSHPPAAIRIKHLKQHEHL